MIMLKFKLPKINLSLQLVIIFCITIFLGSYFPLSLKSGIYAFSASLKEILLFVLPFIIFVCLFSSMLANQGRALKFAVILLISVCISNFLSIIAAYGAGNVGFFVFPQMTAQHSDTFLVLEPLWTFSIPSLISNEIALFLGLFLGIGVSLFKLTWANTFSQNATKIVTFFLQKTFIPLLPLFAFGFLLKMEHDGVLVQAVKGYAPIILIVLISNLLYLGLMFGFASSFSRKTWVKYIKNVLPVGLLGFSTMSSLATMPVTLNVAEKNTNNPEISRALIPATVNIHMIGDSISIPIIAMAILLSFGYSLPTFNQYLIFTAFFMLAKFAVPGVPCGTMLVMLPIFEKYLGFTTEMSSFIASIYILFDPIVTAANVLGNSALVIILTKLMNKKSIQPLENLS